MSPGAPPPLPVERLVLWRHGRTAWNATGRFQGQLDPPLDDVGREQAARTAPQLVTGAAPGGLDPATTVVVSSDLSRAAQTAATLSDLLGVPLRLDARLREHGLGTWEGLTRDEVAERYPDQYADWVAGRVVRGRGGEQSDQVATRALAALAELPAAAVAVAVTHGGTAGRLVEALLQLGSAHRRVLGPLANCGWSELVRQGDHWRLLRHNGPVPEPAAGRRTTEVPQLHAVPPADTADAFAPRAPAGAGSPAEDADAAV